MVSNYGRMCVTGGAGFIGSHIVDRLIEEGYEVVVIDDLSTGRLENIKHNIEKKTVQFVKCDIRDSESVRNFLEDVDVVFHEAALTSIQTSLRKPALTNSMNVSGTLSLLETALDLDVKRFVYASSAAVYGNVPFPQREDGPTRPFSVYGVSKLAAEGYVRSFNETYGLKTVCLRYFNVYGPRQSLGNQYSGVITRFIGRLLKNKPLTIYGDGYQSRDFVCVEDVIEANMLALKKEAASEVFNVGTGNSTSINKLARMLMELTGKNDAKIVYEKAKSEDIKHSCADITKIRKVLRFDSRHNLPQELTTLIDWQSRAIGRNHRKCL